ncbi:MAG: hypothetical protein QG642_556 [Patescibacteria group bacterium]|nr:hypothetical protein [Patescibacteria group bacterium]
MGFIEIIGLIILFVLFSKVSSRVKVLEDLVRSKNFAQPQMQQPVPVAQAVAQPTSISSPVETPVVEQVILPVQPSEGPSHQVPASQATGPSGFELLIAWLREEWLMKLGSLLMLFGFGWFVNTNTWLGPNGSVTLGIVVGAVLLILGAWRIKEELHQGSVFLVLGSSVVLLTVYAARNLFGIFNPYLAFLVIFLSTAFIGLVSVKNKIQGLAVASLILASFAPLLVGIKETNYVSLFTYLLVVILGVIWVVAITGWRNLTLLSIIMVSFHSAPVMMGGSMLTKSTILLFAYALASIFYIANTYALIKFNDNKTKADVITAVINGTFLLVWILAGAQEEWKSLIVLAWMLVFVAGAFLIFRQTQRKIPLYIYTGVGITMLAAATTIELDGGVLTIAYTVESAVISLLMFAALKDHILGQKYSLLLIGPVLVAFSEIDNLQSSRTIFNSHFFAIFILALALLFIALTYRYFGQLNKRTGFFAKLYIAQVMLASIYIYVLIWQAFHIGIDNNSTASMLAIIIYTIIGLITNIYGKVSDSKVYFFYGGTMLILVVLRLLLVDFSSMDNTRRIITFFFIGFLLIVAAVTSRKKKITNNE